MNKDMVLILRDDGHELQTAEYTARYDRNGKRTIAMGLYEKSPFSFRVERLTEDKSTGLAIGVKEGEVFIKDAFIGSGIVSANYNVKLNINNVGKSHEAGMTLGVEDGQSNVEFMADRYTVHEAASSIIENAVATSAKTKIRLGDEMKQAVIDAVRESDLFASLQAKIDAQKASVVGLQQAMHEAVNDALLNALKPGGLLYKR
ncbi:phage tail tip fiber protein [Enterobacter hormaechei]|uniref:phage tail tip fiber protein n=1 Tax=Enterobacter hormaechei TaxID=158836 RepID=UPI003315A38D